MESSDARGQTAARCAEATRGATRPSGYGGPSPLGGFRKNRREGRAAAAETSCSLVDRGVM
jgi:hypothetical protein